MTQEINEPLSKYIGCYTFLSDGHRVEIVAEKDGLLVGKCVHGDIFIIGSEYPLYRKVR